MISIGSVLTNSGANQSTMSVSVSGAGTVAANDQWSIMLIGTGVLGRTTIITGLTAGTNTFTLSHKVTAGTGTFEYRNLIVQGIA
jgi:hypothetical protein